MFGGGAANGDQQRAGTGQPEQYPRSAGFRPVTQHAEGDICQAGDKRADFMREVKGLAAVDIVREYRGMAEQLREQVLDWRDGRPVRLGDVAEIRVDRGPRNDRIIQNGNPAMGIRIDRQNGANVLAALTEVKRVMSELREGPMAELGLDLQQSFDASVFIQRAVRLVTGNLLIGVLLAVGVLWWFLRSIRGTVLIAIAIPVSLLATFVVLKLTGRSLNVISLAGLAFAVGMVLDAAIVVSENIVRLRERGEVPTAAALAGSIMSYRSAVEAAAGAWHRRDEVL